MALKKHKAFSRLFQTAHHVTLDNIKAALTPNVNKGKYITLKQMYSLMEGMLTHVPHGVPTVLDNGFFVRYDKSKLIRPLSVLTLTPGHCKLYPKLSLWDRLCMKMGRRSYLSIDLLQDGVPVGTELFYAPKDDPNVLVFTYVSDVKRNVWWVRRFDVNTMASGVYP